MILLSVSRIIQKNYLINLKNKNKSFTLKILLIQTSVDCVCILTFFTLPVRCIVGEVPPPPLYPGFCIPNPSLLRGRGFFKLERSGDRVTDPTDDPFVTDVTVVFID